MERKKIKLPFYSAKALTVFKEFETWFENTYKLSPMASGPFFGSETNGQLTICTYELDLTKDIELTAADDFNYNFFDTKWKKKKFYRLFDEFVQQNRFEEFMADKDFYSDLSLSIMFDHALHDHFSLSLKDERPFDPFIEEMVTLLLTRFDKMCSDFKNEFGYFDVYDFTSESKAYAVAKENKMAYEEMNSLLDQHTGRMMIDFIAASTDLCFLNRASNLIRKMKLVN